MLILKALSKIVADDIIFFYLFLFIYFFFFIHFFFHYSFP